MTDRFKPAPQFDDQGRPVLAGLTFEETQEFEELDARLPFEGQHVWPREDLPILPLEQRWNELWVRHRAALAANNRKSVTRRRP
jgi:hypothetical protein